MLPEQNHDKGRVYHAPQYQLGAKRGWLQKMAARSLKKRHFTIAFHYFIEMCNCMVLCWPYVCSLAASVVVSCCRENHCPVQLSSSCKWWLSWPLWARGLPDIAITKIAYHLLWYSGFGRNDARAALGHNSQPCNT